MLLISVPPHFPPKKGESRSFPSCPTHTQLPSPPTSGIHINGKGGEYPFHPTESTWKIPGVSRSSQELPGASRSSKVLPGAPRSVQELPGGPRKAPRTPRMSQREQPGAATDTQEARERHQEQPRSHPEYAIWLQFTKWHGTGARAHFVEMSSEASLHEVARD